MRFQSFQCNCAGFTLFSLASVSLQKFFFKTLIQSAYRALNYNNILCHHKKSTNVIDSYFYARFFCCWTSCLWSLHRWYTLMGNTCYIFLPLSSCIVTVNSLTRKQKFFLQKLWLSNSEKQLSSAKKLLN